ncbi:MAG: hypothetical protein GX660_09450, partial [Clostridiaceae bacterium]|nr:hypothetical protein [Clostridiaceae bacterium]
YRTITIYILIGVTPFLFSVNASIVIDRNIYDLYFNIFSNYSVTFILIPLFVLLLEGNAHFFDDIKVITRFENKLDWWNKRLSISAVECLCFTVFTNMIIYIYICINNKFEDINYEFVLFTFKNSLIHFLGYLVLFTCFISIACMFEKIYIGIMVVLFVFFIDFILFASRYTFNIILDKMYIYGNYISDMDLNLYIARSSCYLCAMFLVLNLLGYKIFKGKDLIRGVK